MKQKLSFALAMVFSLFCHQFPLQASSFRTLSLAESAARSAPMVKRVARVFEKSRGHCGILPRKVKVVEVGPRDGLQNRSERLSVSQKVKMISFLRKAGLPVIEAGAFVNPKEVPAMAGSDEVARHLVNHRGHPSYPFLVPNRRGLERAIAVGVKEIAVFTSPSEAFLAKNIHMTVEESLQEQGDVIREATDNGMNVRGYVSCVMGCPYEGDVNSKAVADVTKSLLEAGCYEISLGDTIGVGTLESTTNLLETLIFDYDLPPTSLAAHFHDTNGEALSNILLALMYGIRTVDSSVGGLGACPYAKGATGNVATEEVVSMLHELRVETGVSLHELEKARHYIENLLGET